MAVMKTKTVSIHVQHAPYVLYGSRTFVACHSSQTSWWPTS